MISLSVILQLFTVIFVQFMKKSKMKKLKEVLITILFLRPGIDAYRVSTHHHGLTIILAHMLILRFGFSVQNVSWTSEMVDWSAEDNQRVGRSMSYFSRMTEQGDAAVGSWRSNFPQLGVLFEVEGFEDFMNVIASNLLRDNKFGLIFRVASGAFLSTLDAVTDVYTISTYYQSEELAGQATSLLVMVSLSMFLQLFIVIFVQYRKKSKMAKLREVSITNLFLRLAVDAYRVSTNLDDDETV